ncbi:MAG: glycosyltransferase family protein [archaeon]
MKVLFVVSGIGYGDATRELSVIRKLLDKHPQTKIMVAGYDNSYEFFKNMFDTIKIKGYKLPGKRMKLSILPFLFQNILLPVHWLFSMVKIKSKIKNFKPDIIISDFEPSGIAFARLVFKKCIVVFGYDPLTYKEFKKENKVSLKLRTEALYFEKVYNRANLVIIPKIFGKNSRDVSFPYIYVDSVVRQRPEELPDNKILMKKYKFEKRPIIVMMGGSKLGIQLAKNINNVADKFNEHFIIFGGECNFKLNNNITYIPFSFEFLEYLKISKGVITLGGQKTISESLLFKKPLMLFPIRGHVEQVMNAYEAREYSYLAKSYSAKEIAKEIKEFLKVQPALEHKLKKLKIETNGAKQIVKVIETLAKKS